MSDANVPGEEIMDFKIMDLKLFTIFNLYPHCFIFVFFTFTLETEALTVILAKERIMTERAFNELVCLKAQFRIVCFSIAYMNGVNKFSFSIL